MPIVWTSLAGWVRKYTRTDRSGWVGSRCHRGVLPCCSSSEAPVIIGVKVPELNHTRLCKTGRKMRPAAHHRIVQLMIQRHSARSHLSKRPIASTDQSNIPRNITGCAKIVICDFPFMDRLRVGSVLKLWIG